MNFSLVSCLCLHNLRLHLETMPTHNFTCEHMSEKQMCFSHTLFHVLFLQGWVHMPTARCRLVVSFRSCWLLCTASTRRRPPDLTSCKILEPVIFSIQRLPWHLIININTIFRLVVELDCFWLLSTVIKECMLLSITTFLDGLHLCDIKVQLSCRNNSAGTIWHSGVVSVADFGGSQCTRFIVPTRLVLIFFGSFAKLSEAEKLSVVTFRHFIYLFIYVSTNAQTK